MIKALFLDLDNTLYPASSSMESDIVARMNEYTSRIIGMGLEEAKAQRKERMPRYGTTLEWLMAEYGFSDPDDYFAYVHPDGEERVLAPDPALRPFLQSIRLPKFIFTNAPMEHATRVLAYLGISDCFARVFDVRFNQLHGKPARSACERVIHAAGVEPHESLFADDVPRYVQGFIDAGGAGVLVDHDGRHANTGMASVSSIYELKPFLEFTKE